MKYYVLLGGVGGVGWVAYPSGIDHKSTATMFINFCWRRSSMIHICAYFWASSKFRNLPAPLVEATCLWTQVASAFHQSSVQVGCFSAVIGTEAAVPPSVLTSQRFKSLVIYSSPPPHTSKKTSAVSRFAWACAHKANQALLRTPVRVTSTWAPASASQRLILGSTGGSSEFSTIALSGALCKVFGYFLLYA